MYKYIIALLIIGAFSIQSNAQSFAVNTDGSAAHSSAMLDVKSNNKGILVPVSVLLKKMPFHFQQPDY
jgi:archaellum component FlaG (FlaF/FlaG flagellin family)